MPMSTNRARRAFSCDPSARGYQPLYREREPNRCPGCGRAQWIVGRMSAECAFCATALPFAAPANCNSMPPVEGR